MHQFSLRTSWKIKWSMSMISEHIWRSFLEATVISPFCLFLIFSEFSYVMNLKFSQGNPPKYLTGDGFWDFLISAKNSIRSEQDAPVIQVDIQFDLLSSHGINCVCHLIHLEMDSKTYLGPYQLSMMKVFCS